MNSFEQQFHAALTNLLDTAEMPLLAVSGGVDSMTLLHLFHRLERPAIVAHCNFQLRGAASDADAALVKKEAEQLGLTCYTTSFNTLEYAQSRKVSVQMAARELRYQWFNELCDQTDATCLITAHHLNDSVETLLVNLVRGTGIKGLTGIAPRTWLQDGQLKILRPLLAFSRQEIESYATAQNIQWREDESNAKDDYLRNYLRHHTIPGLEQVQPAFLEITQKTIELLRQTAENYQFLIEKSIPLRPVKNGMYGIDLEQVNILPHPESALWEVLKAYGFTAEQVRQMLSSADKTGTNFISDTQVRVLVDRNVLLLDLSATPPAFPPVTVEADDLMIRLPDGSRLMFMDASPEGPFPDGKEAVLVDADRLKYPLQVRNWLPGDFFQPFGMGGKHRKLQDFLTDLKLNLYEKEQVRVLLNGDGAIIWVLGHRLDERFRVKNTSNRVKKIMV